MYLEDQVSIPTSFDNFTLVNILYILHVFMKIAPYTREKEVEMRKASALKKI
jgi:hypothetical protein